MKAAHRHQLETNSLAQRLDEAIERFRPHAWTFIGVIVAFVAAMTIWSYASRSSTARQGEAWNAVNGVLVATRPDLEELRRSAQEFPNSQMQEFSDITWADGLVRSAAFNYIYNRTTAMQELERATSAYQSILATSGDERLLSRAHLGMARVYELRNEPDRAREEYLKVGGGYAEFAKAQAVRLAKPETKEAMAWLAKSEPPRPRTPAGPGTPGQRPAFSEGDIQLPAATPSPGQPGAADSFDQLIKDLGLEGQMPPDGTTGEGREPSPPATDTQPPTNDEQAPATSDSVGEPPANEKPAE
jgi:hypothetical protein